VLPIGAPFLSPTTLRARSSRVVSTHEVPRTCARSDDASVSPLKLASVNSTLESHSCAIVPSVVLF